MLFVSPHPYQKIGPLPKVRLEIASINVWPKEEDNLSGGCTIFLFQNGRCVEDYMEEFIATSHQDFCSELMLLEGFRVGLDEEIQMLMPSGDPSWGLAQYVNFALCIAEYSKGGPTSHRSQSISHSSFKPVIFKASNFQDSLMPTTVRGHLSDHPRRSPCRCRTRRSPCPRCHGETMPAKCGTLKPTGYPTSIPRVTGWVWGNVMESHFVSSSNCSSCACSSSVSSCAHSLPAHTRARSLPAHSRACIRHRPPVPAPSERPPVPAPSERPLLPAPPERPPVPAPPEPSPPERKRPQYIFLGGGGFAPPKPSLSTPAPHSDLITPPYLNTHLTALQCPISFVYIVWKRLYVCGLSFLTNHLPSEESPTSCVLVCVRSSILRLLQWSPVSPPLDPASVRCVSHLYSTSSCIVKISPLTPILYIDLLSGTYYPPDSLHLLHSSQ